MGLVGFYLNIFGRLAQLVERYPYKVDVISSSLIATTMTKACIFRLWSLDRER